MDNERLGAVIREAFVDDEKTIAALCQSDLDLRDEVIAAAPGNTELG